jgi:hypothetical protein
MTTTTTTTFTVRRQVFIGQDGMIHGPETLPFATANQAFGQQLAWLALLRASHVPIDRSDPQAEDDDTVSTEYSLPWAPSWGCRAAFDAPLAPHASPVDQLACPRR